MRALDPEVLNAVWAAVKALIPPREDNHPLGCHRPRIFDRLCFRGILIRLVTGCSWAAAEQLLDKAVSDTTLRTRRDEWVTAGVFDALATEAVETYDRIYGLDLGETTGRQLSSQSAPRRPGNREKPHRLGNTAEWSLATDRNGIPLGWAADGANRHDSILFDPTLTDVARRGLIPDTENPPPRPRIRQQPHPQPSNRLGPRRPQLPQKTQTRHRHRQNTNPPRDALGSRTNQPVAVELRATTPPTPTAAPNTD